MCVRGLSGSGKDNILNYFISIFTLLSAVVNSETCFFAVNGSSGFISSDGTKTYVTCAWILTAPSNHTVKLKFTMFRFADKSWNQASIQVYDGKRKNDTVLGIFSGTRHPFIVQTSGRFMMLTLQKTHSSTLCYFKGTYYAISKKGYR